MINIHVKCPHCGKSMMSTKKKMGGKPAIEAKVTYAGKNAPLYMSSVYGTYDIELDLKLPLGKIAGFRCHHCKADLKSTRKCDVCSAQMVAFDLKGGGQVQICSRRGCKKHILEFQDPKSELQAFYKSYLKTFK